MLKSLKKRTCFFFKLFLKSCINSPIGQIIKSKLTNKQKRFLLGLFRLRAKPRRKPVEKIVGRLYNLGITDSSLKDLEALINDKNKTSYRRYASFELARWYANQHDIEGAKRCLELIDLAKEGEGNFIRIRHCAILEAECYEKIGDFQAGKRALEEALALLGPESNLYLALANFEESLNDRVSMVNKVLSLHDLDNISINSGGINSTIDKFFPISSSGAKSLDEKMLVSVIVPAYNSENTIGSALNSILSQTWSNLEVLVVDDCSNDHTADIVEKYTRKDKRVSLIRASVNRGPYVARNMALKVAQGEYVTTHDADDWSHPEKIERQAMHLMENPSIIGNTSQLARTYPALKFYRGNNPGNIIQNFISSLMFRREPVMNALGYWDCVRLGADNEYMRRIIKVFGEGSVLFLKTGPLTFYRKTSDSLTGNKAYGHPGYYMGVRKEYYEAQTYHHSQATDLYYPFPQRQRPFAVPKPMSLERYNTGPSGRRHFDVIIVSDFCMRGGSVNSNAEEIKAQKKMGIRTGLVNMYWYKRDPENMILPQIRELVDGVQVQVLVYGEKVSCNLLIVRYPPVLMEMQRYVPDIEADHVRVIINQAPQDYYGEDSVRRYYFEQCQVNLEQYFGKQGIWHPNSPIVRKALKTYHREELSSIKLSDEDWVNIIDVEKWRRKSRPPEGKVIRIGRHSSDRKVKWLEDPELLLKAYPDSEKYKIKILGGAKIAEKILGYLPQNWQVKAFGDMDPQEYLAGLDVFVYFPNTRLVESFSRAILEAMATGVPVILPPVFCQLFQDAAIYSQPDQVEKKVTELMADHEYYDMQVNRALDYLERNYSYTKHMERINKISGKKIHLNY